MGPTVPVVPGMLALRYDGGGEWRRLDPVFDENFMARGVDEDAKRKRIGRGTTCSQQNMGEERRQHGSSTLDGLDGLKV
jgi:hypothetical protein